MAGRLICDQRSIFYFWKNLRLATAYWRLNETQRTGRFQQLALGDPHRQRILLMFERGERLSIGDIVAASTLSRTAVAHHLRVLRDAGVLRSEKVGREVWFWPDPAPVRAALDAVDDYLRANL